jgi:dienelactone hydrolase
MYFREYKMRKIIFISAFIHLCFTLTGCAALANYIYMSAFARVEEVPNDVFHTYITWNNIDQNKYSRKTVYFNSGSNLLQGFIYGASNNNGLIILSQGLGNTADHYLAMVLYFVDRGWRVFAYNNTGVSGSEGDSVRGLTQSLFDIDAALDFVNDSDELKNLPIMLIGHSWGGFAVCTVLNYDRNINAVVSFAGFNNGSEVIDELAVLRAGRIYYLLSNQVRDIERRLFGDAVKLTAVDGINKASIPVMIVQSSDDDVIFADTISIYAHRSKITNPYAEIVFLYGENAAGHEFVYNSNEQREYVNWAAASWKSYKAANRNAARSQWAEEVNFNVFKANALNMELMNRINELFLNAR